MNQYYFWVCKKKLSALSLSEGTNPFAQSVTICHFIARPFFGSWLTCDFTKQNQKNRGLGVIKTNLSFKMLHIYVSLFPLRRSMAFKSFRFERRR